MAAILEVRNHSDVVVSYEVVIIRVQKAGLVFGKSQPAKEKNPSNEELGNKGWARGSALRAPWRAFGDAPGVK